MKENNLSYVEEIVGAFDEDKIISCAVETEIIGNDYGDKLTYTIVVENKSEPKTMEEFFEQRQGDFTFVEAYEYNQKLKRLQSEFDGVTGFDSGEGELHARKR